MNYEKKYKEALGWMQSLYDELHGATKEDAEHYFPELKEGEDERKQRIEKISRVIGNNKGMFNVHKEMQSLYENWSKPKEKLSKISKLEREAEEAYKEAENKLLKCKAQQFVGQVFQVSELQGGILCTGYWRMEFMGHICMPIYR